MSVLLQELNAAFVTFLQTLLPFSNFCLLPCVNKVVGSSQFLVFEVDFSLVADVETIVEKEWLKSSHTDASALIQMEGSYNCKKNKGWQPTQPNIFYLICILFSFKGLAIGLFWIPWGLFSIFFFFLVY